LSLFAALALAVLSPLRAADSPPPATDEAYSPDDPITIVADTVRYWNFQNEQWVVLEGHAAVLSGVEGIRADRAVARVRPLVVAGEAGSQVLIYAEGTVTESDKPGATHASVRRTMATKKTVELKAHTRNGRAAGKGVPTDVSLVKRAFPDAGKAQPAAAPTPGDAARATQGAASERGSEAAQAEKKTPAPLVNPILSNERRPFSPPDPPPASSTADASAAVTLTPTPSSSASLSTGSGASAGDSGTPAAKSQSAPPVDVDPGAPQIVYLPAKKPKLDDQVRRAQATPADAPVEKLPELPPSATRLPTRAEPASAPEIVPAPLPVPVAESSDPAPAPLPALPPIESPDERPALPASAAPRIGAVPVVAAQDARRAQPAQAPPRGFPDGPDLSDPRADPFVESPPVVRDQPPAQEAPPRDNGRAQDDQEAPKRPIPFPMPGDFPPAVPPAEIPEQEPPEVLMPVSPTALRSWSIAPRAGGENSFQIRSYESEDGTITVVAKGGVMIVSDVPGKGTVDISADSAVIWTKRNSKGDAPQKNANDEFVQDASAPLEAYLEGNVVIRNDARKYAGNTDSKVFRAPAAYYDLRTERMTAPDADVSVFAPGLITPLRIKAKEINQYRPLIPQPDGKMALGLAVIQGERSVSTGSRFPNPGYRFNSRSLDLYQLNGAALDPNTGIPVGRYRDPNTIGRKNRPNKWRRFFGLPDPPRDPNTEDASDVYRIDARQNVFFIGAVPFFYWPRFLTDSDDLDPTLRMVTFSYVQYFGTQYRFDINGFKLLGIRKPSNVDTWNIDLDYLSRRGPALGSEIGWFGNSVPSIGGGAYNGYLDMYGIWDHLTFAPHVPTDKFGDDLGPGPAVTTDGPVSVQRNPAITRLNAPFFNPYRGRFMLRHMQSFLDVNDAPDDEEMRLQLEAGYLSDRNFLEQYYKRLFDSGLDQSTDAYFIRQMENRSFTALGSVNLQSWYTDTQFLPKLEYYRLGDSFFNGLFSYSTDSGIDYANVHTAVEVNHPNLFILPSSGQSAFIPYDPVSNTSGPWASGRAWTSHEIDMPVNLDLIRFVPYAQGQLTAWDNQLDGSSIGRAWGGVGARANVAAFRNFPGIQNELLNINGLSHKISFDVDARFAYSNVNLNRLGIQDTLDDNTYEWVRRYFALTNYVGGVLPPQYDPRFLTLRRTISPIAGTTDVQATIDTIKMGIHQRLQTKRGPVGKQRITDWMIFDLSTTYFPDASRDNFGKPFGQNMYNWEWFIGDRTSIVSTGWFEFFNVTGQPILASTSNHRHTNDPLTFDVINVGISISRPPRGSIYMGYSIVNTGPIATSALSTSFSYLLSPKWYSTFATVYDFGNGIWLTATGSVTRIGADWLTSFGVAYSPLQKASTVSVELVPRLSPNLRFGQSSSGMRFDPRFAPTQ
jgi:hypothetical protein